MQTFTMDSDFSPLEKYELIYLASPYTNYVWSIHGAAADIARITGRLILKRLNVFSPIVHSHYVSMASGIDPLDHSFWMKVDESFMHKSDALLVCQLSGWQESKGVNQELERFLALEKPRYTLEVGFVR